MIRSIGTLISLVFLFCGCDPRYGFIESQFRLSPDSRLPKWIENKEETLRKKYDVRVTFYTLRKAKIVISGPPESKVIFRKVGKVRWHPETENQFEYGKDKPYPRYSIITVNGISEVFEHREAGPTLHITDDPRITSVIKNTNKTDDSGSELILPLKNKSVDE